MPFSHCLHLGRHPLRSCHCVVAITLCSHAHALFSPRNDLQCMGTHGTPGLLGEIPLSGAERHSSSIFFMKKKKKASWEWSLPTSHSPYWGSVWFEPVEVLCMPPVSVSSHLHQSCYVWITLSPWSQPPPLTPTIFLLAFCTDP